MCRKYHVTAAVYGRPILTQFSRSAAATSENYPRVQDVRLRAEPDGTIYISAHTAYIKNVYYTGCMGRIAQSV